MHRPEQELKSIVMMYSNAVPTLTDLEISNCTITLRRLILKTRQLNDPSYADLKLLLSWTTSQLEQILKVERLDDVIYEDGCLNDFYGDIITYFGYPIHLDDTVLDNDFVYWGSEK